MDKNELNEWARVAVRELLRKLYRLAGLGLRP